ncbi:hypothetical protein BH11MYX3_BH11MYX3_11310 [soil metagenome]
MNLERATWRTQPWKNGGGITHEIWRAPDLDPPDLRVSLADVAASGPFSLFPGYRRWTFLVGPAPITLTAESPIELLAPGDHIELPGDAALTATLRAGATQLLNVLARIPVVVGFGPVAHPVRFTFDLTTRIAVLDEPPRVRPTSGCVWIA